MALIHCELNEVFMHYEIEVNAPDRCAVEALAECFQRARNDLLHNPSKNVGKINLINKAERLVIPNGLDGALPDALTSFATYSAGSDEDFEEFLVEVIASLESVGSPHVTVRTVQTN
ncbi:MAG: hypothetical protein ACYDCF_11090 [Burkholderiales bacterium]|uniref:Uncharacterized protein n=1 Tax=Acidithiobacillus thiooxidans TaxID=930 RepID=A0A1C2IIL7_ACITH|nr:hypothetical protein [Acidithiobacillus thiooxidans]OCX68241.1 hypothetical protein A6P07_18630 [Acidithiobacillus thiooxidans]OCX75827.1 hypothetical protein A6O24_09615 [Acidithiobacillus thiooxidans]OCX79534.1 hypothetical protein A6O26_16425 [Acidithiobacillus thiooxidans]OCX86303.1 hypothetical protein A6M27_13035 [Acidithiobacillus thiooxidans]OFC51202.1 hypothetical protein BAE47_00170 [Acidithiobacillus thiooxidans]